MDTILDWLKIPHGTKIGKLFIGRSFRKGCRNSIHYITTCSCGKVEQVSVITLKRGKIECFCCALKSNSTRLLHGFSKTRLHRIWGQMLSRCLNNKYKRFDTWGGRGITVCNEWRYSFLAFRDWSLKNGYKDSLSIDRINNDGNYEPSNCRWATNIEQGNNTRNTKRVTIDGVTKTITEWAEESPVSRTTIFQRIFKYGIDPKDAISKPLIPVRERRFKDGRFLNKQ